MHSGDPGQSNPLDDDPLDGDDFDGDELALGDGDEGLFGFSSDDGEWVELVRDYAASDGLGGIGPYEILEEVGRGSQGVVYRGRQPGLGRDIALKRLIAGGFSSESTRERFQREMEAAASLNHPSIVTVHGFEIVDGLPLMAMEWVDGEPITRWARPRGGTPRSARDTVEVFLQLCDALRHAHQNGVLHRDLKPSNVLVSANGRPHVLDFGLAKQIAPSGDVSITHEFVGTMAYASPEQFGTTPLDVRSDVYSLGVILYEMLTGERPYRPEEGIAEFISALERENFARPRSLRPELDAELDWICAKALAANRDERYQGVDSLADDLRWYLAGRPVAAHPPSVMYELKRLVTRNRMAASLAAVLLFGSIAGTLFFARQASVIARRAEEVEAARDAEAVARARAEALLKAEAKQRRYAQLAWRETFTTLRFLRDDVLLAADPGRAGPDTTLRETLATAATRIGPQLESSPIIQAFVRRHLGEIQWRLGLFDAASEQLLASLTTGREQGAPMTFAETAVILSGMYIELGREDEAEVYLDEALVNFEAEGISQRDQTPHWNALDYLTEIYLRSGRLAEVEQMLTKLDALSDAIGGEFPGFICTARVRHGQLLLAHGDPQASADYLTANLDVCRLDVTDDGHDFARLMHALAEAQLVLEHFDQAEAAALRAIAIFESTLREGHPRTAAARGLLERARR